MKSSKWLRCFSIGMSLYSNMIHAHELDARLDCQSGAHEFIKQLVDAQEIGSKPMRVSDNSVNAYQPRTTGDLTALGFKVSAVFGFSPNDDMFSQNGSGGATNEVYGVVVMAGKDAVGERIHEIGSPATVKEVMPLVMTAVVCQK
ncbi:hypothetical protein AB4Y45_26585 [Paraburkholderia sp. EG287A]|uniref:hypothetical protein n=1 Tax=Paraburkholderia sp. EG287A TaxID=3237012 RepID=UPI0034D1E7CB